MIRSWLGRHPVRTHWLIAVLVQVPIIAALLLTGAESTMSAAMQRTGIAFNTDLVTAVRLVLAAPEALPGVLLALAQVAAPDIALLIVVGLGVGLGWPALKTVSRRYRFWSSEVGWRRGAAMWVACVALFSLMNLTTALLHLHVFHTPGFVWSLEVLSLNFVLAFLVAMFLDAGAVFEESGWRGFVLPRLQDRFGALRASVVLGVLWSLWHMPVKFNLILQYGFGNFLLMFALLTLKFVLLTIIMTYFFNALGESIFIAIVMHGLSNDSVRLGGVVDSEVFGHQMLAEIALVIPMLVAALALILWTRTWLAQPQATHVFASQSTPSRIESGLSLPGKVDSSSLKSLERVRTQLDS
jgi:uncharacterized protein